MPTIAVVATQVGYLLGGLVAIEFLFNYQGIGLMVLAGGGAEGLHAAHRRVCSSWAWSTSLFTLLADILFALLNPRIRYGAAE